VIYTETGQRVARAFEGALRGLSPREFGLLVLRYRDDLPQTEIAEREGVSPARINFLFKRIVTRVRAHVLMEIPDETSAHWLGRDGLATVLKDVIARILGKDR
jgi:DNA-binding CsgD family transcriptional regulator